MSDTKFTPGPWRASMPHQGRWPAIGIKAENGRNIADVWDRAMVGPEEVDANARLIAAGPEMYEALTEAREFIEDLQLPEAEWSRVLDVVVAALAKAVQP